MNTVFRDFLEEMFIVYDENHELLATTGKGFEVLLCVNEWKLNEVKEAVSAFDPSDVAVDWWKDEAFRSNYNEDIRNAVDDLDEWKKTVVDRLDCW